MSDANVAPDPGNSAPEAWSEPLAPEELVAVQAALAEHASDADASEAGLASADFVVIDGNVVPVDKPSTTVSAEPAPVEYRSDEEVAKDAEPTEMAVDQTPEVDGDGSSSPSN